MKVKELMTGKTVNADFEGFVINDDFVLAINTTGLADTKPEDYDVLEIGVAGLDPQLNPITQDKTYIRAGQSTTKTGTQRTFAVTADRYKGDVAQDYCIDKKYATGNDAVTDYVYFCILNGKGEQGKASIIVNSDGGGNAGENAAVSIDLKKSGSTAVDYVFDPTATL